MKGMTAIFKKLKGFTLIELLVTISLIAVIAGVFILIINPQTQLKKARDAIRKNDLQTLSQAITKYSLDNGKYPLSTENYQIINAPWGSAWQPYFTSVPKDPLPSQKYAYYSDSSVYQLYAKLEIPDRNGCGSCGPAGAYNWSLFSNNSSATVLPPEPTPTPAPSPTPTPTPSPIPIPIQRVSGDLMFFISTKDQPQLMKLTINPFDPAPGVSQSLTVSVRDISGSIITRVSAIVRTDQGENTYNLSLLSGSNTNGIYSVSYKVTDSHEQIYNVTLRAANANGSISVVDVQLEGSLENLRSKL